MEREKKGRERGRERKMCETLIGSVLDAIKRQICKVLDQKPCQLQFNNLNIGNDYKSHVSGRT